MTLLVAPRVQRPTIGVIAPPGAPIECKPSRGPAFAAMLSGYRDSGGIASGDDLARLLAPMTGGDIAKLARLIVAREIFSFQWQGSTWIPLFQFDLSDASIRRDPQRVVAELPASFDGWDLARWFIEPNEWLEGGRPLDLLSALPRVLAAARADRFLVTG